MNDYKGKLDKYNDFLYVLPMELWYLKQYNLHT